MRSVCLCGSFKFTDQLIELKKFFDGRGIACYVPRPFKYRIPDKPSSFTDEWLKLPLFNKREESRIAVRAHLKKIKRSDVSYIVNPSGYVGNMVILEIGYAYALGKPIYSLESIKDPAVMSLITEKLKPEELVNVLKNDFS